MCSLLYLRKKANFTTYSRTGLKEDDIAAVIFKIKYRRISSLIQVIIMEPTRDVRCLLAGGSVRNSTVASGDLQGSGLFWHGAYHGKTFIVWMI